ncbi:Glycerol acyltransferase [Frankia sp. AiPs1]|uniref:1-acyl-sn-glycerol-3-phosphate acyltransferase n=1 Tax=Frankia sp. AiPa1 TaxID=573492 RepID=UPI00202ACB5E|nr:1-acyl-sn-glycerol-3-phosphate acyltransferase [Frankia sp. AiPa1]MCL9762017.1 1-acyl-sn-glycerol-3-phosphate acyltransferase [Frankia sp. AiPa1]
MVVPPWAVRRFVIDPVFVPVAAVGSVLAVGAAGLGLLVAPVLDRRLRLTRAALMVALYLAAQTCVIVIAFALWLVRPVLGRHRYERAHLTVLRGALAVLVGAAHRLVRLELDILEPPRGPVPDGSPPVLVLSRHAGPGDSFVLVHLLLSRYRLVPRVVLVHTLRLDPAIDILLSRLGACFLRNDGSQDDAAERIGALAGRLGTAEALVIFPEGANFTPGRRRRLIARLRARGQWERAAVAEDFDAVLPPRPAGVLAALTAGTIAATMIVAHVGLDELAAPADVWRAIPFRAPLALRWWWVPAAEIPESATARTAWLTMHWAVVNAWISARRAAVASPADPATPAPSPPTASTSLSVPVGPGGHPEQGDGELMDGAERTVGGPSMGTERI